MANPNIFAQFAAPRSIADYQGDAQRREANALTLEGVKRKNAMEDMALQQGQAKQNALMQIMQGWTPKTTAQERAASLRTNPLTYGDADAIEKADLEAQKTRAGISAQDAESLTKNLGVLKRLTGAVMSDPTPENARAAIQMWEQLTGKQLPQERERVAFLQTPEQVRSWAAGYAMEADKLLPQLSMQNLGGNMASVARDPLSGAVTTNALTPITQSADNAASQQTALSGQQNQAQIAAAGRAVTMRGQNLQETASQRRDRTTRDTAAAIIGKPLTEGQAKAVLFGARMETANKILDDLEKKGVTASVPGSRAGYGIGAVITALSPAERQQLDQAKRDFINAVLRRESGAVIADSEFDNGDKQYFPQIGDSKEVIAQKKRNREIAMRGIQAEVPEARKGMFQQVQGLAPDAVPEAIGDASDPLGLRR